MNDELEKLSDAQLSEVFAAEVAGWKDVNTTHWQKPDGDKLPHWNRFAPLPPFASSADAALLFLGDEWGVSASPAGVLVGTDVGVYGEPSGSLAIAPTFARAACIALIRAKRNSA